MFKSKLPLIALIAHVSDLSKNTQVFSNWVEQAIRYWLVILAGNETGNLMLLTGLIQLCDLDWFNPILTNVSKTHSSN